MKTLLEILKLSSDFLAQNGIEESRREAENLFADALGLKRMELYLNFEKPLTDHELRDLRSRLKRRAAKEPAQYIQGSVEFYGCQISINSAVLIPRQETEILADIIAQDLVKQDLKGKSLLDLCTGSGCLGLALKKRFPELETFLSDISEAALSVAKQNGSQNNLQVTFLQGDLLAPLTQKVDFIVCNPPYIAQSEYEQISPEVRDFEPRQALLAGTTGLEIYQRLQKELPSHLHPQGKVWLEIGASQGAAVCSLFADWKVQLQKDWAGHDRFVILEKI